MQTVSSILSGSPFIVDFSAVAPSTPPASETSEMTEDEARAYFVDLLTAEAD